MTTRNLNPVWLDSEQYPFTPKRLNVGAGEMSYIDEGKGPVLLMVHGTPSWSFLYRDIIKSLSTNYRCIAIDHLGFGLSDKPEDFDYTPMAHAKNLEVFIEKLELKSINLIVHDFGGPIGLSYAVNQPENISSIVIMNTWMWHFKSLGQAGRLMANPLGRFLYKTLNFSINILLKNSGVANKANLPPEIFEHYKSPFKDPNSREALFALINTIDIANPWFDTLWKKKAELKDKPTLLAWGMKDKLIPIEFLQKWREVFDKPEVLEFEEAGHFLQEEVSTELAEGIDNFLKNTTEQASTDDSCSQ